MITNHINYMNLALSLAERGRHSVSPNPMVGCVIVKDGNIIGQGFHERAGEAHAEIIALRQAGSEAKGADMYVTLEPCCHYGRTPPCTNAIIQAGIKKVYAACIDPHHLMAGKGIATLTAAGVEVETSLRQQEAEKLNEFFFHYIRHKKPFVTAKWAMSLDGKTCAHQHDTANISCDQSRQQAHQIRQYVDAILVGANTARIDNPQLTARYGHAGKQPKRIILSSNGKLPLSLNMFNPSMPSQTIVATTDAIDSVIANDLRSRGIEILITAKDDRGMVDLHDLLFQLGKREIISMLVEGGMRVLESFFQENLVNQISVFLAPVIIGTLEKKKLLTNINLSQIEQDFHITASTEESSYV